MAQDIISIAAILSSPLEGVGLKLLLEDWGVKNIKLYRNIEEFYYEKQQANPPTILFIEIVVSPFNTLYTDFRFVSRIRDVWRNNDRTPKIIILSGVMHGLLIRSAIESQVDGIVLKNQPSAEGDIVRSIERVLKGGKFYSDEIVENLVDLVSAPPATSMFPANSYEFSPTEISALTPRQVSVMKLIAEGLKNEEIAERLYIAANTVSAHKQNIVEKLGLKDRSALTKLAMKLFK